MTRDEAIAAIDANWPTKNYTMLREALTMAKDALRAPAVTGERDHRVDVVMAYAAGAAAAPPVTGAPPDLVALVQRAQKAFKASQGSTTGHTLGDWTDALADLLAWSPAPAPVAPPADGSVQG